MENVGIESPERLFIGGQWLAPSSNDTFEVLNAATEKLFIRVAAADEFDVERAVTAARRAFDQGHWPRMPHRERARYLRAIADEVEARSADFARAWVAESGVIQAIAQDSATALAANWRFYADLADTFMFEQVARGAEGSGDVGLLVREPVGVVAAIIAWNAPASLITNKIAPAFIAGCTVVVKMPPEAPTTGYIYAEICEKVGLPDGVFNMLTADRAVSESLVRRTEIDKVTLTGSTAAGRKVGAICGERIARCTLELGGKSPGIILDDFDIEAAAQAIGTRAIFLTGQVCASLTRIIVSRTRHDAFVDALASVLATVVVGDPLDPLTQMGPLASPAQLARVQDYIAKGKADGATLVAGGARPGGLDRGYFIEPTVFGHVDNRHAIAREEIFGPVLSVIAYDDEDHAVSIANDTIYGLNAAVFTTDADHAYAVARRLRSGTVGHNAFRVDPDIAFGGFKQSGLGREGGAEGLYAYLETKTVLLDDMPSHHRNVAAAG